MNSRSEILAFCPIVTFKAALFSYRQSKAPNYDRERVMLANPTLQGKSNAPQIMELGQRFSIPDAQLDFYQTTNPHLMNPNAFFLINFKMNFKLIYCQSGRETWYMC